MRKIIAAINVTVDGFCDHTVILPDEQIHDHYTQLLQQSDTILYGRTTYALMEYWRDFIKNPSGEKDMDDFASAIDKIQKIVFSRTLKYVDWDSATLSTRSLEQTAATLRQQNGSAVLVGSRSLIVQLLNLNLIDELQLCVHPVIAGKGLPLFDKIVDRTVLKLLKTKIFDSGAVVHYYTRSQ